MSSFQVHQLPASDIDATINILAVNVDHVGDGWHSHQPLSQVEFENILHCLTELEL